MWSYHKRSWSQQGDIKRGRAGWVLTICQRLGKVRRSPLVSIQHRLCCYLSLLPLVMPLSPPPLPPHSPRVVYLPLLQPKMHCQWQPGIGAWGFGAWQFCITSSFGRQTAGVDNAPVIGETYSHEFSDVGGENESRAVKLHFFSGRWHRTCPQEGRRRPEGKRR